KEEDVPAWDQRASADLWSGWGRCVGLLGWAVQVGDLLRSCDQDVPRSARPPSAMLVDVQRKTLISGEIEDQFSKGNDQIIFPNSFCGGAVPGFQALRTRGPASFPP